MFLLATCSLRMLTVAWWLLMLLSFSLDKLVLIQHSFTPNSSANLWVKLYQCTCPSWLSVLLQLSSLPSHHWQLSGVVRRLFYLLPPSHIQQLSTAFGVEQFPLVTAHLSSTGHLDTSQLHGCLLQQLITQISAQTLDFIALVSTVHVPLHVAACANIVHTYFN